MKKLFALGLVSWAVSGGGFAQDDAADTRGPEEYRIERATSEIRIDGVLDEPAWNSALAIPLGYEWFPGDAIEPPVETTALLTYDDARLYVAFDARDPEPEQIRAHLMDRDQINTFVQDDHVTLMIDAFNDERRAVQFRINPLGVQADAIFSEVDGIEDFSWDIIWDSAGAISDSGFVVEIALPFNQLRFPRTDAAQTWGIELGRSYPRSNRHRIAANFRDRDRSCLLCQIDKVTGFVGLEPGRNLEFDPTLTVGRTDRRADFPDGPLVSGDENTEPGLSVRWGITPNVSLNATINPDFSQVEADVAQLAVNERFALFFEEKRPFFLEGVDFFSTPFRAVFTRTVVDPKWGLKLTSKEGKNAFGVFVAEDRFNSLLFPGNQGSSSAFLDLDVTASVLRYRRDIGKNSTLGVLFTGREADDYHNRVGGLDGFFRLSETDTVEFQYLNSNTQYPGAVAGAFDQPANSFDGEAFRVNYDHQARKWLWFTSYRSLDPEFRADSGFITRVDLERATGTLIRRFRGGDDDWWNRVDVGLFTERSEDHSGRLTEQGIDFFANVSGPLQSFAEISLERNKEFFGGVLYEDLERVQFYGEFQPTGAVELSFFTDQGETIDFSNNQPADLTLLVPGIEGKIGRHINVKLDHTLQRLDVEGGELFEANLSQLRFIYNFNVRMFARAIFQYTDIARDPLLYSFPVEAEFENLFTQLLFSYKVNPQTLLFVGYSDNRRGGPGLGLTQSDRTFFLKLGYAWIL
ncbi:MAG: DUF5916 domain-containing protein [Thermoanaerobaculia bacterium]